MEEHPVEDEASLSELFDDSDDTDLDQEDTPEGQFNEALKFINTRHESFSDPETLYEFLFKYGDVLEYSSPVSGTLLHSIATMMSKGHSGIDALAKRLIQEHPKLLCIANSEGLTPVSMAVVGRGRQFIRTILRTCSDDPACRQALEEALKIPDFEGKTVLHHSSRFPSTFKVSLTKLMAFATDEALGIQDGNGCTPLHYVVSSDRWRHSLLETVESFLARDIAAQRSNQDRVQSSEPAPTFLDVLDRSGLSVYQRLISSVQSREAREESQDRKMRRGWPRIQETLRSNWKNNLENSKSMSQVSKRVSDPVANMKQSVIRETEEQKLAEEARPATTKPKDKDVPGFAEISSKIAQRLKIHYVRTRDIARASRFLYGENPKDIQLYFNYTGGPAEVRSRQFEAAFESTEFCDVLKFVAFSSSVSVVQDTRLAGNVSKTREAGFGRRDMEFFSKWLQRKGVKRIISMQVYDFGPCHSDKSIAAVLQPFEIEDLDWRKVDLDPRTIQEGCHEVRSLTLWWGGNNTTLRAWSEPTGLPALPHLKRLSICLPREIQAADSMACVENNIAEFRKRLQCSLDSQTGPTEYPSRDSIDAHLSGEDFSSIAKEYKDAELQVADEGEDSLLTGEINVPVPIRTSRTSTPAGISKPRSLHVQFSASRALSHDPGEPTSETQEIAVPSRWLRCVDKFSRSFSDLWDEVQKTRKDWPYGWSDERPVVALIDDGIDILDPSIPGKVVHGGTSFAMEAGHRLEPWWVSNRGHGTMVASLISWVCPMVQLYSIRVGPAYDKEVDMRSLARALESALKKATVIVLGIDMISPSRAFPELDKAIQEAHHRGAILLRPMPDSDSFPSGSDPVLWDHFWSILSSGDERTHIHDHGFSPSTRSLVLPGTKAVVLHLSENNSPNLAGLVGVLSRARGDESSVATALAAGLMSTLISCYKLTGSFKAVEEGSSANKEAETSLKYVMQAAGMEAVLKNLGDLTEDRVIKVWQTLDGLSKCLGDKSRSLDERVNQLAEVTRHLALGLRD